MSKSACEKRKYVYIVLYGNSEKEVPDMATINTKVYVMEMVLEYAKVFKENADYGDPDSNQKWLRELSKSGGQTAVNAYFTSEDQINQLLESGYQRMTTNPSTGQQVDTIKVGNPEFGIGQYIQLKRKVVDIREYKDSQSGEFKELDLGGFPGVVDLTEGEENKRLWDYEEKGQLGHGTRAYIEFEVYKGGSRRLSNLAITDHIAYEETATVEGLSMFKVDAA
tara:strand:+ start:665 stop:1333 length:669 start_codon:yes stop_codon:yes gene_type:complete